jgi:hypothetical protein
VGGDGGWPVVSIVEYEKRDHHPDVNLAAMLEHASRPKTLRRQDD